MAALAVRAPGHHLGVQRAKNARADRWRSRPRRARRRRWPRYARGRCRSPRTIGRAPGAAGARAGCARPRGASPAHRARVRRPAPGCPRRPSIRCSRTSTSGSSRRWRRRIVTAVDPATTVASSPCSASAATASSTDRGCSSAIAFIAYDSGDGRPGKGSARPLHDQRGLRIAIGTADRSLSGQVPGGGRAGAAAAFRAGDGARSSSPARSCLRGSSWAVSRWP